MWTFFFFPRSHYFLLIEIERLGGTFLSFDFYYCLSAPKLLLTIESGSWAEYKFAAVIATQHGWERARARAFACSDSSNVVQLHCHRSDIRWNMYFGLHIALSHPSHTSTHILRKFSRHPSIKLINSSLNKIIVLCALFLKFQTLREYLSRYLFFHQHEENGKHGVMKRM